MQTRDTARVVLLDPTERVLLIKIEGGEATDPSKPIRRPFWITPGGRIEDGEVPEQAVGREIREETGLSNFEVGPYVWYGEHTLLWKGVPTLLREKFFLARAAASGFSTDGMTSDERLVFRDHRWWSVDEILASDELFIPRDLGRLVSELLGATPTMPRTIDLTTPDS